MSYTHGPWICTADYDGHVIRMSTAIASRIKFEPQHYVIYDHEIPVPDDRSNDAERAQYAEADANATLIATAPDLLEAGNDLLDALLTIAPSTMYPKIVADAMNEWITQRDRATGR